jgi:hypothetical protein
MLPSYHASEMPWTVLAPYLLFIAAAIATICVLHLQADGRRLLFTPVFALMSCALVTITPETYAWSPPLLASSLGIVCIGKLIALPRLLLSPENPLERQPGSREQSLRIAWQTWNNPRELDLTTTLTSREENVEPRLLFAVQRTCRIIALMAVDSQIVQKLVMYPTMSDIQLQDLTPDKEILFRRLISSSQDEAFSSFDLALRLLLPLQWLWSNFLYLEVYHDCLAIIFVSILQIDGTQTWPPLFGNITEAYTVKRFWGKFWHRIVARRLTTLAQPLSRHIFRSQPGSHLDKVGIAFGIFLFSGLGHAAVAWRAGEGHETRDVMFYVANFAIGTVEVIVEKTLRRKRASLDLSETGAMKCRAIRLATRVVGYIWVYFWFVWLLPRWQYPKLYSRRLAQLEMEIALLMGQKPQ